MQERRETPQICISRGASANVQGPVSGITSATAVAAGQRHTCALLLDGTVKCWGDNNSGQLGADPSTSQLLEGTEPYSATLVSVIGF
ncbi:MAG TPA: RCC1 domain-containing protein [Nitrospiria bacterium]